jgi:hypothetical protein
MDRRRQGRVDASDVLQESYRATWRSGCRSMSATRVFRFSLMRLSQASELACGNCSRVLQARLLLDVRAIDQRST